MSIRQLLNAFGPALRAALAEEPKRRPHAKRFGRQALNLLIVATLSACSSELLPGGALPGGALPSERTEVIQQPVRDGFESDDAGVMALFSPTTGSLCSGALIAPNVILTARHCVASVTGGDAVDCATSKAGALRATGGLFATTAPVVSEDTFNEFKVSLIVGLEGTAAIPSALEDLSGLCGHDFALVVLADNVDAAVAEPYLPRIDEGTGGPLVEGEGYDIIGYGITDERGEGAGVRRRRDDLELLCIGRDDCQGEPLLEGQVEPEEWVGNGGVCQGDSGGPALDAEGRVIGVASRGTPDCSMSVHGAPNQVAQWLKDGVVFASGMGLYEPPPWTEGSTVDRRFAVPIGQSCSAGEECPGGTCLPGRNGSYCTRICSEQGPCPESYSCQEGNGLCVAIVEKSTSYTRADRDGCALSGGPSNLPGRLPAAAWLSLLGLCWLRSRRSL